MINGGYAIDFADFDGRTEPEKLVLKKLPSVNKLFAEKVTAVYLRKTGGTEA